VPIIPRKEKDMKIARKDKVQEPFINTTGERVYEMIGRPDALGGSSAHSFGHVVIPPKCSSRHHYHPVAEETYYILAGRARMVVDGNEHLLTQGDAILIMPPEHHQIFSIGDEDLEFIVVCAPAWEPTNSVYLD
jgi:ethanolamine utilization protein EutQ